MEKWPTEFVDVALFSRNYSSYACKYVLLARHGTRPIRLCRAGFADSSLDADLVAEANIISKKIPTTNPCCCVGTRWYVRTDLEHRSHEVP